MQTFRLSSLENLLGKLESLFACTIVESMETLLRTAIANSLRTGCHSFVDAESMAKWEVGRAALARKTDQG
jgi:hypothetical protein